MEYKRTETNIYVRFDPNDEIISTLMEICRVESIDSACFQGIGGCKELTKLTYDPETGNYTERVIQDNLDGASILGNITKDETGRLCHHTHSVFSRSLPDGSNSILAGHTLKMVVSYAAEFVLTPVTGTTISRTTNPENGAQIWHFN